MYQAVMPQNNTVELVVSKETLVTPLPQPELLA